MPFNRRLAIAVSVLTIAALGAGGVVAQLESGDRGILPIDSTGTLEITGIHVDVGGKDAASARYAGWRIAQREGYKALWAKQHKRPISEAPNLSDSVLDGLVSSIIVEKEEIGPDRYIADLGVLFDRARAGELLGFSGEMRRSAPMLLVAVLNTGGALTTVEEKNPWQRAWAQFRTSQSPIDYVRVSGLGPDPLLVNAAQTRRPGRGWWRNIIDYYGAADILVAEVTLNRAYPGGPAVARFVGRHGPDGEIIGGFTLRATDGGAIPKLMAQGVERMDALFAAAQAAGRLHRDPSLIMVEPPPPVEEEVPTEALPAARVVQIQILTRDEASLNSAYSVIRSVPGVAGVSTRSAAVGGWSLLLVNYRGNSGTLAQALASKGWGVTLMGWTLRVNPGQPGTPVPTPTPPVANQNSTE